MGLKVLGQGGRGWRDQPMDLKARGGGEETEGEREGRSAHVFGGA